MLRKTDIKKLAEIPTPFYFYDLNLLRETVQELKKEAGKYQFRVHYALKANNDNKVLATVRDAGLGADCVSGNEVKKALEHNFNASDIFYAGVGKTDDEILTGIEANIGCFNCESLQEITVINEIAGGINKTAKIALRINPHVDSKTHSYITTGTEENKFGIQLWELDEVLSVVRTLKNIELTGLHFHIGSQITNMDIFKKLSLKVNEINERVTKKGFDLSILNLGGGFGVDYDAPLENPVPDFKSFFHTFYQYLKMKPGQNVYFELGRSVVAQMGTLIAKVLYIKKGRTKNFAVVDAGMTELIRPALYNSVHKIENLSKNGLEESPPDAYSRYDIVGPVCETTDFLGKNVNLPLTFRGDLLAVYSVGAYGQSMASNYNLREKAGVVYSDEL